MGSMRFAVTTAPKVSEVLAGLLTFDITDFAGKYYRLTGARCDPKQQPPPLADALTQLR